MRRFACVALLLVGACGAGAQPGAGGPAGACATLGACDCFARSDCNMVKESCWCASECGLKVACPECTSTKFIRCEAK